MLGKKELTDVKDTKFWSSGMCVVLLASMKFSLDFSLCVDLSVRGLTV